MAGVSGGFVQTTPRTGGHHPLATRSCGTLDQQDGGSGDVLDAVAGTVAGAVAGAVAGTVAGAVAGAVADTSCDWTCEPWVPFDGGHSRVTAASGGVPMRG